MNYKLLVSSLVFSAFFAGYFSTFLFFPQKVESMTAYQTKPVKRISILQPVTHPALEQIKEGFKHGIKAAGIDVVFTEYNGNGNGTLIRAQADQVINTHPDLIFTIATGPALVIKELTIRKNKLIPVVCGAAAQEKDLPHGELITHITGTDDMVFEEQQLAMLKFLKPSAEKILLVYDGNAGGLESSIAALTATAAKYALTIIKVPIFSIQEITQKTAPFINQVDTMLVLKDNTVVSGLDALVKLCNNKGITLMASDLDSVDRGAALAFGVSEYEIGTMCARQAVQILKHKTSPNEIPFTIMRDAKIKVNATTAPRQGLILNDQLLFLLENGQLHKERA